MTTLKRAAHNAKTPPQTKSGLITSVSNAITTFMSPAPGARPLLMETVSWGAIALSTVLAAVGVAGIIGWESWLAKLGTGILIGGTLLTEIAASRLPVHAERRIREGGLPGWAKGAAVIAGFGVLTAWNVIAGHFGMAAIDGAGVADKRAPIERAAAIADADRETAEEALAAFDAAATAQRDALAAGLRGAFESGYVTAASRSLRSDDGADAAREERAALARDVARTRAADRAAEAELARAPTGRRDIELWAFAIVLELLKGALVWFATASRAVVASAPMARRDVDLKTLLPAERRELKRWCASTMASLRHIEAARA